MIKSRICIRVIFYIMCEHKRQMSPQFEERTSKNFQRFRRQQWNIVEPIKQRHFYAAKWSDASEKTTSLKTCFSFFNMSKFELFDEAMAKKNLSSHSAMINELWCPTCSQTPVAKYLLVAFSRIVLWCFRCLLYTFKLIILHEVKR